MNQQSLRNERHIYGLNYQQRREYDDAKYTLNISPVKSQLSMHKSCIAYPSVLHVDIEHGRTEPITVEK